MAPVLRLFVKKLKAWYFFLLVCRQFRYGGRDEADRTTTKQEAERGHDGDDEQGSQLQRVGQGAEGRITLLELAGMFRTKIHRASGFESQIWPTGERWREPTFAQLGDIQICAPGLLQVVLTSPPCAGAGLGGLRRPSISRRL